MRQSVHRRRDQQWRYYLHTEQQYRITHWKHLNVVLRNGIKRNTKLGLLQYIILCCYVFWVSATTKSILMKDWLYGKDFLQKGKNDNILKQNCITMPGVRYDLALCSHSCWGSGYIPSPWLCHNMSSLVRKPWKKLNRRFLNYDSCFHSGS